MGGRVTSNDTLPRREAVNRFGVSYRELYEQQQANHARVLDAYRKALQAWEAFNKLYTSKSAYKKAEALRKLALELTTRATS